MLRRLLTVSVHRRPRILINVSCDIMFILSHKGEQCAQKGRGWKEEPKEGGGSK